jgi:hypothetical protein
MFFCFSYGPPSDWGGHKIHQNGLIQDVLGIVIGNRETTAESGRRLLTSIIRTPLGLAFEPNGPNQLPLGIWVRVEIKPHEDHEPIKYVVVKREKIGIICFIKHINFLICNLIFFRPTN